MRRLLVLAVFFLVLPAQAHAQPRLSVGAGFTAPSGDLSNAADPGYHVRAALQLGLPTLPVGLQADGTLHRLGAAVAANEAVDVLAGSLSVVFTLPGVGLQPYVLGGVGTYRTKVGPSALRVAATDRGYHAGFGVVMGALGLGGFAEIRFIQISGGGEARLIPLTLGLRF